MLSESRRKKLEMLMRTSSRARIVPASELLREHGHTGVNRGDGAVAARPVEAPAATADGTTPSSVEVPPDLLTNPLLRPLALEQACPGEERSIDLAGAPGRFWQIRRTLGDVAPDLRPIASEYDRVLRGARQRFDELDASVGLCHAANATSADLLFMDTETCGLTSATIFLVGVMFFDGGDLVFEQYLARDYSEEPAVLATFFRRYERCNLLVTFNGKAFDMTMIRERSAFHQLDAPWAEPPHLDLLHEARRLWKGRVPNYRLQTLEHRLCGRRRVGDIPGAAIPDAYHRFVETRDARRMQDILHHNLLDLLTMAQLLTFALTGCDFGTP